MNVSITMFKKNFLWGGSTAANQIEGAFDLNGNIIIKKLQLNIIKL